MNSYRAPLREPPITADPLVLREQPSIDRDDLDPDRGGDETWDRSDSFLPLPPDLPPPIVLDESIDPVVPNEEGLLQPQARLDFDLNDAPPPPELPPLEFAPLQPLPPMAE
jgi:hypothetical protein